MLPDEKKTANRSSTTEVLRCEDLHKWLGEGDQRVHVLRGVHLSLQDSATYAIVGPSGCGKSTLLYLLGLLDQQDEGQVFINRQPMSDADDASRTAARNRHLGFVFQFHFLLAEFTAEENVMLPMRKLGDLSEAQMRERANQLLNEVGLGDKTRRLSTQLSGGEQQRVAVARALANQPAVVLADEPTGNLDEKNSKNVFGLLQRLAHEQGLAILMVSHNITLAEQCDHTYPMRDGSFDENSEFYAGRRPDHP